MTLTPYSFRRTTAIWNQDTDDWEPGEPNTQVTPESIHTNLTNWYNGPKTPGLMILEHELSDGSVQAFIDTLANTPNVDFPAAVKAAGEAALKTRDLEAKAGRSAYVEGDRLKEERVADPGAWGVKAIVEGLLGSN